MKAQTLPEAIRNFDPLHPLRGDALKAWYIARPADPLARIKIYLQGLAQHDQPIKLLFTGHVGCGKSTTLNKLAEELKGQFFIVPVDVARSLSLADLTYTDLMLAIATSLFGRATEPDVLGKAPAQIASAFWEDLTAFISEAIFGLARFRTAPPGAEASAKVNFQVAEFQLKYASEAATRDEIRQSVEPRLGELIERIDAVAARVRAGHQRPVLFFIEGTDKPDLARARDIFMGHTYTLTAFRAAAIYTFPIALRYAPEFGIIKDRFTETFMLPNLSVANRDGSPNPEGLECLSTALMARLLPELIEAPAHDAIVRGSGGLMRTLVRLAQRSAVNATADGRAAIALADAEAAINEERADYVAGLRREDYPVLYARHQDKQLSSDEEVFRLLQTRALLEYDGEPWCDVHPVALPEVLQRVGQTQS